MYEEDYPHEKYPAGIIKIGISKQSRLRVIVIKYSEIGFTNYNMIELAELTLNEWRDKKYPIPEGYRASTRRGFLKDDLKSNPFVK